MFECPGCHEVDPKPTPAQHCRVCQQYQEWRILEAFAPLSPIAKLPRSDGLCPACGENEKCPKSGYCLPCRRALDKQRHASRTMKVKWKYGFCVDCGAPESRKANNGGCLNCRARGRRMEYEAVKQAQGKTVKKMKRRVALEATA